VKSKTILENSSDLKKYQIIFENGLKYEGSLKENPEDKIIIKGIGKFEFPNGDQYIGELSERCNGELTYNDGTTYKGQFYKLQKSGLGVETHSDGTVYIGMFKQNVKWGKGRIEFSNGDVYVGSFKNGMRSGIGKYNISSGGEFVGDWKDDHLEGKGKWIVGDGSEILGAFQKSRVRL
jgi:hypothetical protein